MKEEVETWLAYADDNLASARVLLRAGLFNPCLQNIQQSVEKYLKALLLERYGFLQKTHSIATLLNLLHERGENAIFLSDDECALLDAVYLPSKYPLGGVLPDFIADERLCRECLDLAESVASEAKRELSRKSL